MAKRHDTPEPTSSKGTMLILVAGGVLVAALVVWALTRTVEPAATPIADTATSAPVATPAPAPTSTQAATGTATGTSFTPPPATGQTPPPTATDSPASVPRMAVEDLRAKHNRGEVTLIDVRDARSHAVRHIPGSMNIPFASIESQLAQIPRGKPIVTYCT